MNVPACLSGYGAIWEFHLVLWFFRTLLLNVKSSAFVRKTDIIISYKLSLWQAHHISAPLVLHSRSGRQGEQLCLAFFI